ncbi:MAG: AEC family transporter, partial [Candidatus Bathyarchaeota archaeon]
MYEAIIRTTVPIFLLIGVGLLSRRIGILKAGDERVLSAYVYYFALPALLLINMAETSFTLETLRFMLASVIPVLIALTLYVILYFTAGLSKKTIYLLILSTIFGSLAFFGIPFITFAFPLEGEKLATLSVASISIVSVIISITVLELYQLEDGKIIRGLKIVLRRLSRNPLILSIIVGILLSIIGVELPLIVSRPL